MIKINNNIMYIFLAIIVPIFSSCRNMLDETVYSELVPDNYLTTAKGINSTLNSAFAAGYINGYDGHSIINIENWCTDIEWETSGAENRTATLMINFTWDASTTWINDVMWDRQYIAVRNANTLLDNVDAASISDETKVLYKAEARFIRALSYSVSFILSVDFQNTENAVE